MNKLEREKSRERSGQDLVGGFQNVVETAMRIVREKGSVDDKMNEQTVVLEYTGGEGKSTILSVTDVDVEVKGKNVRSAEGFGWDSGLFIKCIELDNGEPISFGRIQLPRAISRVTEENLGSKIKSDPKEVWNLAKKLSLARKVDSDRFYTLAAKYRANHKATLERSLKV